VALDPGLRDELVDMSAAQRRLRAALAPADTTSAEASYPDARRDLEAIHAARLWEILDDYECWPGVTLVGDEGAEAAWLLAQHARFDPQLQHRCLEMLELAVDCGDAPAHHLALLLDGVRMADGKDQVYGSQLVRATDADELVPWPIEDAAGLDARRAAVGLPPMADYLGVMRAHDARLTRR
jgi:uncharacterized protein DUF6624